MAELRDYGLVKNETNVEQIVGPHRIAPGSIGRLPAHIVESMRTYPTPGLTVLQDHPDLVLFFRTELLPFGPRYQK